MKRVIQGLALPMAEHQRESMELRAIHFELSSVLTRSVALYQEMKFIPDCKMAASYVSKLKRQLKQNFQTTPRTRIIQLLLLRKAIIHNCATSIIRTCLSGHSKSFFHQSIKIKLRCELNLFRLWTKPCKRFVLTRVLTDAFQ